jgi:hypothetical protein
VAAHEKGISTEKELAISSPHPPRNISFPFSPASPFTSLKAIYSQQKT